MPQRGALPTTIMIDTVEGTSHHAAGPTRSKIHTRQTTARLYHLVFAHTVTRPGQPDAGALPLGRTRGP
ncbi:MAG: hypothetical protein QOJ06_1106 [Pseudonocardiales bacterium]|jgi:hypothetical protein|nr:hypothetical protein [Pseudonocardiales bacterium]